MTPASDHSVVFAVKKSGVCSAYGTIKEVRAFNRYNKAQFCKDVAKIPWSIIECVTDINDAVNAWCSLFFDVVDKHASLKKLRVRSLFKPWITEEKIRGGSRQTTYLRKKARPS